MILKWTEHCSQIGGGGYGRDKFTLFLILLSGHDLYRFSEFSEVFILFIKKFVFRFLFFQSFSEMTKAKQQGPAARKFQCGRCGVLRWTEQFAGVGVSKLTPSSTCDLCKIVVKFEERLEQLQTAYLSRESQFEARIAQLEKEVERLRRIITDAPPPTPEAEIGKEVIDRKKKKKKKKNKIEKEKVNKEGSNR